MLVCVCVYIYIYLIDKRAFCIYKMVHKGNFPETFAHTPDLRHRSGNSGPLRLCKSLQEPISGLFGVVGKDVHVEGL